MSSGKWKFRRTEHTIELDPPTDTDPAVGNALWDFITAEIGESEQNLNYYRGLWARISTDPEAAREGISGNGTRQHLEGDDVVLEALYDQWETVRIPRVKFEQFLDQFADYLKESEQRS